MITGATGRIGLAMIEKFKRCGEFVNAVDIDEAKLIELESKSPEFVKGFVVDIRDEKAIKQFYENIAEKGRIDVVINNAGVQHRSPLESFPSENWDLLMDVVLKGPFLMTKYALPYMKKQRYGRFVNIASVHGEKASPHKVAYISAKHGVIGLTKATALEYAEYNILANALLPGPVETPMILKQIEEVAEQTSITKQEATEQAMYFKQSLNRFITVEEIANATYFLTSDEASGMTGTTLDVSGGAFNISKGGNRMENVQAIEISTVKKTMSRILPFVLLLYVIAYLDRVNLGFAALEMNADLALTAEGFGLLSGIFFIGYFFFEIPSNMIMHKVGARIWIARIMISWGIVVILTGFSQSATHLYILRFLLGIAEAGFFPGVILYFTYWFRKQERGRATSILLLALPLGSLIGAPLSGWIMDNIFWANLASWRWMFILEGIPAVILGIVVIFYLVNTPSQAKWLTNEEKKWLELELQKEREQSIEGNKVSVKEMVKDLNVWKLALIYFANFTCMYGLSFWLPTIIKNLSTVGTTNMDIGWLAMIPALVGIPSILFAGWNSDRTGKYKEHIIASFIIAVIGFTVASFITSPGLMIVSLALASIGLYLFAGCFFAYKTHFFTKETAPVGIALVNSFAALGGFIGPYILGIFTLTSGMYFLTGLCFVAIMLLYTLKRKSESVKIVVSQEVYKG